MSDSLDSRIWPFPIIKPESEWTDFDREYVELMQTAFAEGFAPSDSRTTAIDLIHGVDDRCASLLFRGTRNGWEPRLGKGDQQTALGPLFDPNLADSACVCVRPPFKSAAYLVLEWMRGRALPSLLDEFEFLGGRPSGIVWIANDG